MKYLHYILILILLIISSSTKAQEILFEKTIDEFTIKLIESDGVYRSLYINDSIKKGVILLEEYRYDPKSRGANRFNLNPGHWFGIINTTIKDGTVYILYYNYGLVELKSYGFLKDDIVKVKSYFIDKKDLSPANEGEIRLFAEMKWFNDDLFMYINARQQHGGKTIGLSKYNSNIDSIVNVTFSHCKAVEDHNKLFVNLDLDENKDTVSQYIKEVLLESKQLNKENEFKYLGYIDDSGSFFSIKHGNDRSSGIIYFLYQDSLSLLDSIKIIRYENHEKNWYVGDSKEKVIEVPIVPRIRYRK